MRLIISSLLIASVALAQNDTINQIDDQGRKQGLWVYYGKDRPEMGYPKDGKIEEGSYKDNRKEGIWIKYYYDGKTPKLRGTYHNNRPSGPYQKFNKEGILVEEGTFTKSRPLGNLRGSILEKSDCSWSTTEKRDSLGLSFLHPIYQIDTSSIERDPFLLQEVYQSIEKDSILSSCVHCIHKQPKKNGYQKLYNEQHEILIDGNFKNYQFWEGKVYTYDEDGILLKVKVYKKARYHSDGQL
ncbi:hypothetical protein N9Y60_02095 [Crocinitomicaceae bacterium]|nr:hypothetical protein [Crocinitomicaceae bacterium]MDC0257652.1 hypothetical protein [Crocinitomicaceae bacterium]